MSKYIIKNCPSFAKGIFCKGGDIIDNGCVDYTLDRNILIACQERTDCVMKQIVELCKYQQGEFDKEIQNGNYPDKYKFFKSGRADAGSEIFKKFDIEEVLNK